MSETEHVDRGIKMDVYARLVHVPTYVIYDPFTAQLDVFALDPQSRTYGVMPSDGQGRYWCARLGLFLGHVSGVHRGIDASWLRWIRKDGTVIPTPDERAARAEAELLKLRGES